MDTVDANDNCTVDASRAVDPLILAIDVGTSSARALIYDARGRIVSGWESHRPYEVSTTPDGGAEIDPDFLLELVSACVDEVLSLIGKNTGRIAGVASDTFWHSLMGIGAHNEALTPIYTWADTRSAAAARRLKEQLDERAVHARTGAVFHSSYLPAKILWLQQEKPDVARCVTRWLSFGEYVYLCLLGDKRVSISMASGTGLMNQRTCAWDQEVLNAIHLHDDDLSTICEFSEPISGLTGQYARRWPELAALPWYPTLGDGGCNNIGSGAVNEKWVTVMIGTSGAVRVIRSAKHLDIPWGLWTYRLDRRRLVQGGALSSGGNVFAWLEQILRLDPTPGVERELLGMAPDGHGLTVLPFLAGERSPDWNLNARGAIVGMTLNTSALDIARAALEAVAYRFAVIYAIVKQGIGTRHGIIGSGAGLIQSPAWMQIMTDVLGQPITASGAREASSRGAALMVLEATGVLRDLSAVPVALGKRYLPDTENNRIYTRALKRHQALYETLIPS